MNKREQHQVNRIKQGLRSGELTRHETGRLVHGQVRIRAKEARLKADWELTGRERVRLHRDDMNQANHHIQAI